MLTPNSSTSSDRPGKRMRLGTRSCAECRRRKVRCISAPNSQACKECLAHESPCTPQILKAANRLDRTTKDALQGRISTLEGLVRQVCEAVDIDINTTSQAGFQMHIRETLKRLRHTTTPLLGTDYGYSSRSTSSSSVTSPEPINFLDDAPLIDLFKNAMFLQSKETQINGNQDLYANQQIENSTNALRALIPSSIDLDLMLHATEKFWPLWKGLPKELDPYTAKEFILNCTKSRHPAVLAKGALYLAVSIHQLPINLHDRLKLPSTPSNLVNSYLEIIETLLSTAENSAETTEAMECFTIQGKFYIDMGKPRKAWLIYRRAMNFAILRGIHRHEYSMTEHQKALWADIWGLERHLSLVLGLPAATADSHPGLSRELVGSSLEADLTYQISIIAGHVSERNQNHHNVDYSATLKIEEELQGLWNALPLGWWETSPDVAAPVRAIYGMQSLRMCYHHLRKLLHLPYMLRQSTDGMYEGSRIATLGSSREMIKAYQTLRNRRESALILCDIMDFQIFTAAMALVINILSQPPYQGNLELQQQIGDWEIIHGITTNFKHIAGSLECSVAGQAAEVLEYLSMVYHGTYSSVEDYEVMIPYFGKVRISQVQNILSQTGAAQSADLSTDSVSPYENIVEFGTNRFIPFNPVIAGDPFSEAELDIDWTAVLDMENAYSYDWNEVFGGL